MKEARGLATQVDKRVCVSDMMMPGDPGPAAPASLLFSSTGLAAPLPHFFKNYFLLEHSCFTVFC